MEDRRPLSTITFIQNIGNNSNYSSDPKAKFSSILIPIEAGHAVAANHSVFVSLAVDPASGATPTVTDTAGNIYTKDVDAANSTSVRTMVFSSHGVKPLSPGDSIVATFPASAAQSISASELCGVKAALGGTNTGKGGASVAPTTGAVPVTASALDRRLLIGAVGVEGNIDPSAPSDSTHNLGFTAGAGWTVLPGNGTASGNSGNKNDSIHPEYRIVTASGSYKANGTLNSNANGKWSAGIATYLTDLTNHFSVQATPTTLTAGSATTVTVTAVDGNNDPVSGHRGTITFTSTDSQAIFVDAGTGLPLVDNSYTFGPADDAGGTHHTFQVTLKTAGPQTVSVIESNCGTITGFSGVVTVLPAAADHLEYLQQPTDTVVGTSISPPVSVRIVDQYNNTTTSAANVSLTVGANPGGGTLSGTTTVAAAAGTATFSDLSIDQKANGYTLYATAALPVPGPVESSPFDIVGAFSTTSLVSSDNPSAYGDPVTFTATVSAAAPATGVPEGSVQFIVDGTNFGAPVTLSGGVATSATTSTLSVGIHTVTANYVNSDGNYQDSSALLAGGQVVTTRALTVAADAHNKVYDGNTTATVTLSDDRLPGDAFTVNYASANFNDKNVGVAKPVTVSGLSISGPAAGNYTLVSSSAYSSADITARALTVTATASDKVYDGTTAATVSLFDDRIAGDVLVASAVSATFSDKNIGTGKTVTVSGISISGTDAGNYSVNTTATTTADITARALTVTATANDKAYDGTTTADVSLLDNRIAGDVLVVDYAAANFSDKNVGTGKTVTVSGISISGADAVNYSVNSTATTTADITARTLNVTATGIDKLYDGTTTASVILSDDRLPGDLLTVGYTSAFFDDPNIGVDKPVTVVGLSLSGTGAGNYALASTTIFTTADIVFELVTINGQKFNDFDGDGVKDTGELGIPGWTIQLDLDSNGSIDQTTLTDSNGNYFFSAVGPGTHQVSEGLQAGWLQTFPTAPGTHSIATQSGINVGGVDFGNFHRITASGQKFNDLNGNGIKESGELGLPGWTIQLDLGNDGSIDQTAVTDSGGHYSFLGIGPGYHQVSEVPQFGWTQTFPASGTYLIQAQSGLNVSGLDFGNVQFITISGQKFDDWNGNGTRDSGEPGLPGWTILLDLDSNGSIDRATTTDGSGSYSFDLVPPGTHVVAEQGQPGWLQTYPAAPGTYSVVSAATNIADLDFGNFELVSLSGQIFEDLNANGTREVGEPALSNWTVHLDLDNNGSVDASLATDANGNYSFTEIGPGTHKLSEVVQAGWVRTAPAAPGSYLLAMQSGLDQAFRDFGNVRPAEVHGRKFNDLDGDGTDDGGTDPGIAGVVFQLVGTDGAGNAVSLLTSSLPDNPATPLVDETGLYAFTGLWPGNYTVTEISPIGFTQTAPAAGGYTVSVQSGTIDLGRDFGNQFNGVSFDFNDFASPTAIGYQPVASFFQYSAQAGYGWQTAPPQSGFDRGGPDDLRRDGHFGSADNTFKVLLPDGLYRIDLVMGDQLYARDGISVYAEESLKVGSLNIAAGSFEYPSFLIEVEDGMLDVRFRDSFSSNGGGDPFWVVNALKVQPLDTSAHAITPPGGLLPADGTSIDTFTATGATPGSLVTITSDYGTVVSLDADLFYAGVQVMADAAGDFSFQLRRSTSTATAHIITFEVIGSAAGAATQDYILYDHRLFDFNVGASPTAAGAFGVASYQVYSPATGYGWLVAPPQAGFDRGIPNALLRDGHFGSADNTFRVQVQSGVDYSVTLYFRDTYSRDQISVSAEGTQVVGGLAIPSGTTVTRTFTVASSDGILDLKFHDGGGDPFWIINAVELALQPVSTNFFGVGASADNAFEYGSNGTATEITLDPSGASSSIGTVEAGTKIVYEYENAPGDASAILCDSYELVLADTDRQGVADPLPLVFRSPMHAASIAESLVIQLPFVRDAEEDLLDTDRENGESIRGVPAWIGSDRDQPTVPSADRVDRLFDDESLWSSALTESGDRDSGDRDSDDRDSDDRDSAGELLRDLLPLLAEARASRSLRE